VEEALYNRLVALVIDDQAFARRIVSTMLNQLGFKTIYQAEDGGSGLKEFRARKPDLVICDIEMEPIDGLVFLKTVREARDTKNHNTPVVFLTSHSESDVVAEARQLGVNAFVVKPVSLKALKDRIDFALAQVPAAASIPKPPA
jgi:two-component system chemotaxis response regulator CheY